MLCLEKPKTFHSAVCCRLTVTTACGGEGFREREGRYIFCNLVMTCRSTEAEKT